MAEIDLDAMQWSRAAEIYHALAKRIGFSPDYGCGVPALIDALIWDHAGDGEFPVYDIVIRNAGRAPADVRTELGNLAEALPRAVADFTRRMGREFPIRFRLID